jgi:hypothetical protein
MFKQLLIALAGSVVVLAALGLKSTNYHGPDDRKLPAIQHGDQW